MKNKAIEIDAEEAPELVERYNLRALPAVLLFKGSEPVKTLLGFHYREGLKMALNALTAEQQAAG